MISYRPIELNDVPKIKNLKLRFEDERELTTSTGLTPLKALKESIGKSTQVNVVTLDENIIMIQGVGETPLNYIGVPWAVGTDMIQDCLPELFTLSRKIIKNLHDRYPILLNFVDSRNEKHITWLKYMGFSFPDYKRKIKGIDFLLFCKHKIKYKEEDIDV